MGIYVYTFYWQPPIKIDNVRKLCTTIGVGFDGSLFFGLRSLCICVTVYYIGIYIYRYNMVQYIYRTEVFPIMSG
jgi:hypothetical protein